MAADVKARLTMEHGQFDKAIAGAQKSIQGFVDKNLTLDGVLANVTGTIGKLAGGVGLAMGAVETFSGVIQGSQTTSDEWDKVLRSAKSTVNEFFSALSAGDFSTFSTGLDAIISKAREAQGALDQLGNTTMSYGYFSTRNSADLTEQLAVLKDSASTDEQRRAANERIAAILADQKEITGQLQKRSRQAIGSLVVEGNTLDASQISRGTIDKVLRLDVQNSGEEQKKALAARYAEYQKRVAQITAENTKWETVGFGMNTRSTQVVDYAAIKKELAPVNNEYLDAITYNEVLVKKSDDWLQQLISIQQAADNADRAYSSMVRTVNRAKSSSGGSAAGGAAAGGTKGTGTSVKVAAAPAAGTMAAPEMVKDESGYLMSRRLMEGYRSAEKYKDKEPVVTEMQFVEGTHQYQTALGEKAMKYLSGGEIPVVKVAVDVDADDIEEIDDPLEQAQQHAEALQKELSGAAEAFYAAGSAASAFGGDTLAGVFNSMGAITEMILKLQALAAAQAVEGASSIGFPQNIPAMFTALATVVSVFGQIKNFAEGGIVGGNNFQDGIVARVSSGEMIMNQADQKKLYNSIHTGSGMSGGSSRTLITGEQIVTVVNNHFKRKGRGEVLK